MENLERKIEKGSLYKLDKNLLLTKVDKNYRITNGPAFIDQFNFYHTDSSKKKIYKIKINKKLKIIQKKVFIKFKNKEGSPDGMTLDKQNNLWVCHFGGACISVFNKTGKKIHKIDLPARNITNCTFGGSNNSELFVTSAKKSMSKKDLRQFKLSGSLFRIKTNVNGSIAKRFNYNI
jgi:sugar lactone lactonase YvrE